ncbi:DNA-binding PadR family transcriptional regulator [Kitasatospora sp. SolWspMP-SS2h]|uniref:PadR family transcriptional regulator n=1 Tax=Kitasatospora sp. SolWspMP-SS2h TaxID=1305729 RepID=UPI000DBA7318|nr:PadR family transcriptional regulator [Kitasatospora sp. SolWspMP-SS2h]RAJ41379.1 DNA-binding PadR family transcriptional regulator [Kitasatospora sp. SolWspMP-SS2h]
MTPVFGHGRLRLYLLKLLDESPRHGYEVIRLLEERFHGLYAPSAGTVYPRLAKLEAEGLVSHTTEGGRKVYRLTDQGRAELASRASELSDLEAEIHDSVGQLAGAIRQDVRDNAKDLRAELWNQAAAEPGASSTGTPWRDQESWQRAKEEFARLKAETKEQARRAKEQEKAARQQAKAAEAESRRLREQSRAARTAAQQEALRLKRRIEEQVRAARTAAGGDWSAGLAEGLAELTRGLGSLADAARWGSPEESAARIDLDKDAPADATGPAGTAAAAELPDWARTDPDGDPARELERLLDRFRDHVRDTARDRGVDTARLARAQQALAAAARALYGR